MFMLFLVNSCIQCEGLLLHFAYGYLEMLVLFVESNILFPFCHHSKNQLTVTKFVYFWTFHVILLIYMPIIKSVPHCLDQWSFLVNFKTRNYEFFKLVSFQHCFGYFESRPFPYESYYQFLHFCKTVTWDIDSDQVECVEKFEEYCHILTILSL